MPKCSVTSKGRITIPKELRDQMALKPGDYVEFTKDRSGKFVFRAVDTDFRSLRGILKSKLARPITIEEMDEAIARGAIQRAYR